MVYIAADAAGAGRSKLGESPVGTNALQATDERSGGEVVSDFFFFVGVKSPTDPNLLPALPTGHPSRWWFQMFF